MFKKIKLWGDELSDSDIEETPIAKPPIPLSPVPFEPLKLYQPCIKEENEEPLIVSEQYLRISEEDVEEMVKYALRQIFSQYGVETITSSVLETMLDVVKLYYTILLTELQKALHKCPPSLHPNLIYVSFSQYLICLETSLVKVSNTDFKTLHDFAKNMYELPDEISKDASSDESSINTSSYESTSNTSSYETSSNTLSYETSSNASSDETSSNASSDETSSYALSDESSFNTLSDESCINTLSNGESSSSQNSSSMSVEIMKNNAGNKIFQNKSYKIYKAKKLSENACT